MYVCLVCSGTLEPDCLGSCSDSAMIIVMTLPKFLIVLGPVSLSGNSSNDNPFYRVIMRIT